MRKPMSETSHIVREPDNIPDVLSSGAIWSTIDLVDIVDVDQTQIREAYDQGVIDELKRLFNEQDPYHTTENADPDYYPDELQPISVVRCPYDKSKYWIIDGHHRYQAACETKKEKIYALIANSNGTEESLEVKNIDDLRFLQARENDDAVANRTRETKRRQIIAAMKKRDWNIHQLAEYCHVSWQLAFDVHEELCASGEYDRIKKPGEKVQEAIDKPENVSKSNRELAKELDVSEGTVRKVRKNSKSKKYAPDTGKDAEKVGDCSGCLRLALKPYVVTTQNGEKLRFCSESCAEEYACREGLFFDSDTARFFDNEEDFRNADALDKVSQKAQDYLKDSDPVLEELLSQKNWTEQQRKDFEEGVQAYHEYKNKKSMPKTSDWADEKLDGYLFEEERQRQLEKAEKGERSSEFYEPQRRPSLAKVTAETRRIVPDVEKPTSKTIKAGSIPLKDVDNIQQIVDDVCDWLGDRVAAFAVLFQDKRSRMED